VAECCLAIFIGLEVLAVSTLGLFLITESCKWCGQKFILFKWRTAVNDDDVELFPYYVNYCHAPAGGSGLSQWIDFTAMSLSNISE